MTRNILLFLLVASCGNTAPTTEPATSAPAPAVEPAPTPEPTGGEPVADQSDGGSVDDGCVRDCIASRQMQATDPQTIERDCQRSCADTASDEN